MTMQQKRSRRCKLIELWHGTATIQSDRVKRERYLSHPETAVSHDRILNLKPRPDIEPQSRSPPSERCM
ncbi:hypothetical protein E2C01_101593 [Portunus trituberculatus]|uniref:Uncharacterized protein n=1 Tax=Portunus trituberculatus TaxID=210409 RepID=A0A5B7KG42_PORTR|nr:hypothetical protein [Portunus trituberculatus]